MLRAWKRNLTVLACTILSSCLFTALWSRTGYQRYHHHGDEYHHYVDHRQFTISVLPINMTEPAELRVLRYCSSADEAQSQYAMPFLLEQYVRASPSFILNPWEADIVIVPAYPSLYTYCDARPTFPFYHNAALLSSKLLPLIEQLPNSTVLVFIMGHVEDFRPLNEHLISKVRLSKPRRIVTLRTDMGDTPCGCYGRQYWGDGLENILIPYSVMQPPQFISWQARSTTVTVQKNLTLYFNAAPRDNSGRQQMVAGLQSLKRNDIDVTVTPQPTMKHWEYVNVILRTKFCLVPEGDVSTSLRLFEAIVAECVPMIVSDCMDVPFQGMEQVGNYSDFALWLPKSADAKMIMNRIDHALQSGEYTRLASRLRIVWPHFTMHNGTLPQPCAGALILQSLFRAVQRMKMGLPPLAESQRVARQHCGRV